MLLLTGSSMIEAKSNFYGMEVYDSSQLIEVFNVYYKDDRGVSYTYKKNLVNTNISCWGYVRESNITFKIINNTRFKKSNTN